jgi:hypothetical protein
MTFGRAYDGGSTVFGLRLSTLLPLGFVGIVAVAAVAWELSRRPHMRLFVVRIVLYVATGFAASIGILSSEHVLSGRPVAYAMLAALLVMVPAGGVVYWDRFRTMRRLAEQALPADAPNVSDRLDPH